MMTTEKRAARRPHGPPCTPPPREHHLQEVRCRDRSGHPGDVEQQVVRVDEAPQRRAVHRQVGASAARELRRRTAAAAIDERGRKRCARRRDQRTLAGEGRAVIAGECDPRCGKDGVVRPVEVGDRLDRPAGGAIAVIRGRGIEEQVVARPPLSVSAPNAPCMLSLPSLPKSMSLLTAGGGKLLTSASSPRPPTAVSLPPVLKNVSFPSLPNIRSAPLPVLIRSPPAPPTTVLRPSPPLIESAPPLPKMRSAPVVLPTSESAPSAESMPPTMVDPAVRALLSTVSLPSSPKAWTLAKIRSLPRPP